MLAADLHHAIERGEIDIVFQPQVAIGTGRITGVEALARWRHPTLGPLGADPLFAAAERADLGLALSDHIQQIALQRAARWPGTLSHLRLSINVTAADIGRAGFVRIFLDRVAASGFPIERLTVEITETGLIRELDRAAQVLDTLRAEGVRVAIDDFGTGYSSLAYLTSLPIDYLKIDRALVTEVDGSRRDRVVVRGIIRIATQLGIGIVAEGWRRRGRPSCWGGWGARPIRGFCAPRRSTRVRCGLWSRRVGMRGVMIAAAFALSPGAVHAAPIVDPADAAIRAVMLESAQGWNAGDLDRFMAIYAPDAVFVGSKGLIQGKPAIADSYRKSFAGGANSRGQLRFDFLHLKQSATAVSFRPLEPVGRRKGRERDDHPGLRAPCQRLEDRLRP